MDRVETLLGTATDVRLSATERQNARAALRHMAQGGASGRECEAAREALAQIGEKQEHAPAPVTDGLEAELLRETGALSLGDVEYKDIQPFCTARRWTPEIWALYDQWLFCNVDAMSVILRLYLRLHFENRDTARFLISNVGKDWPYSISCNANGVKDFLDTQPACKDAVNVCREFLETGRVTKLPTECDCWKIARAIKRAYSEKNSQILVDALSQLQEVPAPEPESQASNALAS